MYVIAKNELYHHGILGQRWGVRRFQNPDGTLTEAGKKRYKLETTNKINEKVRELKIGQYDVINKSRYTIKQKYYSELFNDKDMYEKEVEDMLNHAVKSGLRTETWKRKVIKDYYSPDWLELMQEVGDYWIQKHPDKLAKMQTEIGEAEARTKNFRKQISEIGVEAARAKINKQYIESLLEKNNLIYKYDALAAYDEYLDSKH